MAGGVRRPRLTDKVLRGIATACANALAGDVADLTGGGSTPTAREQAEWDEVESAQQWLRSMQKYRRDKKAGGK